jgi:hypothetical protein
VLGFDGLPADLFNELEVLQALQLIIDRDLPMILIEVLPCYSADKTGRIARQEQTEALLRDGGYRLERVIKHSARLGELQPIESIGIHDDLAMCDYVAVPPSSTG